MKTPRQILLEQHRAVGPELDGIRARLIAGMRAATETPPATDALESFGVRVFLLTAWRELFWSSRRVWFGLGGAWLAILVVNTAWDDAPAPSMGRAAAPTPAELRFVRAEQRRLRAELLGFPASAPIADAPATTRPPGNRQRTNENIPGDGARNLSRGSFSV